MSSYFTPTDWQRTIEITDTWWEGKLDRPLLQWTIRGEDPGRPKPALLFQHFTAYYGLEVTPEQVADVWDYFLRGRRCVGDGFPHVWLNWGAGVLAVFLGCKIELGPESAQTVWFHPPSDPPEEVDELRLAFEPANPTLQRTAAVAAAVVDRLEGGAQIGQTDLGGTLDVLSSYRPGEDLLFDLMDEPEGVKARTWEIHEAWFQCFDQLNKALRPGQTGGNPGYSCWTPIFSRLPYYNLQCDFCYMIGPDHFREFVLPELAASCQRIARPFYHLDGIGELPHLDDILAIPELKGIQWIPGDGQKPFSEWPEVYRRIREAGKLVQVFGGPDVVRAFQKNFDDLSGFIFTLELPPEEAEEAEALVREYGI